MTLRPTLALLCSLLVALLLAKAACAQSLSFQAGNTDRAAFEQWFSGLTGDMHAGALYWVTHRSIPKEAHCSGFGDTLQGCTAAQQRLDLSDVKRKSDPEYRLGWNSYQADPAISAGSAPAANLGMIGYGNKAGERAPITALTGANTASAVLRTTIGWDEKLRYCKEQNEGPSCVDFYKKDYTGPKFLTATADCKSQDFVDFIGRALHYEGKREDGDGSSKYLFPVMVYEGFELPLYSYADAEGSAEEFLKMCPIDDVRTSSHFPEMESLSCNSKDVAQEAANMVVSSGVAHVMNLKVVDLWDIKTVQSKWYDAACEAKVTLNQGGDHLLHYRVLPRHGHIMIETELR